MAALAGVALAHGGTAGVLVEVAGLVGLAGVLVWAAIRSRSDHDEGDP